MTLRQVQITNLRNIKQGTFDLHPNLNVIMGKNGSGKTSFLESFYLLGSGHSFRTREISPLIRYGEESLTVFARTVDEQAISIQKSVSTPTRVLLNAYPCQSSSELAYFMPCQVIYQDIFQIIDSGPSVRRSLLDWGLFHVKQSYLSIWKNYKRALKQRNNLLRKRTSQQKLVPWNKILDELAWQLNQLREAYFIQLNHEFQRVLTQLTSMECSIHYYKGWDRKESQKSLEAILVDNYQTDLARQFTQYGAHQADLLIDSHYGKAKQHLSRGQQKIILFALKLAQANLIEKTCIFLCDDLTSELDEEHINRLFQQIKISEAQFMITTINMESLRSVVYGHDFNLFPLEKGLLVHQ